MYYIIKMYNILIKYSMKHIFNLNPLFLKVIFTLQFMFSSEPPHPLSLNTIAQHVKQSHTHLNPSRPAA